MLDVDSKKPASEQRTGRLLFSQWVLERNLGWIAAAEIKVGVVTTMGIAMLGGLAAAFGAAAVKSPWVYAATSTAAFLVIVALVCAAMAVIPRVAGPAESLIFFGRIAVKDNWRYADALRDATDDELFRDCAMQIHRNAQIACEKHIWVRRAMVAALLGVPPWLLALVLCMNLA
ncbi:MULTISPECIES: Pycsar system effector family protein [unclassified Caballeronia]|uniref:Pycsar system effector family protein n=1 Tax=unclassified Caballeronia TaxID=2646786 RepID=UPI00285AD555|nr:MULTISPECIES: Pycsar system effector family protein [unclassified Caballeronia]MDR5752152.1 DUF5706 domain-containing protein [Caballeronia sp. LZ024]MDR5843707.1 DUF5706 domain-containing protein [Caballeronia sp. LZ031]